MSSLRDEIANQAVARIVRETERWCWKALHRGVGWRVWRSDPRMESDANGYRMVHDFQLLPPGHSAPASGTIYGPWSTENRQE